MIDKDEIKRFWTKVCIADPGVCWLWSGKRFLNGYGVFKLRSMRSGTTAHRVAWIATRGPIPAGLFVCHSCDVKLCCNPSHLFIGTAGDNNADRDRKGRQAKGLRSGAYTWPRSDKGRGWAPYQRVSVDRRYGELHYKAKLTGRIVKHIREAVAAGTPQHVLRRRYGIAPTTMLAVVTGKSWANVGGPLREAGRRGGGNAILTDDDVRSIRASTDAAKTLSARYRVGKAMIYRIRSRRAWVHVV